MIRFFVLIGWMLISSATAKVVISEVHWAGSDLSTADEWIELAGFENDTDISGWTLTTLTTTGEEIVWTFGTGSQVASGQYLVLSNYAETESRLAIPPDIVTTAVSLPNMKLLLHLKNRSGEIIDTADDGVGAPMAGANPSGSGAKASMERVLFEVSGSEQEAWQTAFVSVGLDEGAPILGTPGFKNGTRSSVASSDSHSSDQSSSSSYASGSSVSSVSFVSSLSSEASAKEDESSISSKPYSEPKIKIPFIRITEVLANPKGQDTEEWIEIGNLGSGSVNMHGWILDEGNSPGSFAISGASGSFVLEAGMQRSFRKSETALPLDNKGETITLKSGSVLMDSFTYIETAEEVSYGRVLTGTGFQAFCVPTEGRPNVDLPLDPQIFLQQGSFTGEGKTSVNVEARVQTGSLASASCHVDFGDGNFSDSCNPPSHAYTQPGTYQLHLKIETYCGNTLERSQEILVVPKGKSVPVRTESTGSGSIIAPPSAPVGCTQTAPSGARISEVLPNPFGDDGAEWIELENLLDTPLPLCGWSIDDEEGGSKAFTFDIQSIAPRGFLVLPRDLTKIALNNDQDDVVLRNPDGSVVASERFLKAPEGESWAFRSDGNYVWTPFLTPGSQNRFRTAERRFSTDRVIVSAALPNPVGLDEGNEWIELSNVRDEVLSLTGWRLDNKDGGSKAFALDAVTLLPGETRRFGTAESHIQLVNAGDSARLLDPDGNVVSLLIWTEAAEGRIYRPHAFSTERLKARVVEVIDGDTFDVVFDDLESLERAPNSVQRRWAGLYQTDRPRVRVRMIGIDTPETVHPIKPIEEYGKEASNFTRSLLYEKNIELEFDAEIWDKYDRLLAYVYIQGSSVQADILRRGLGFVYLRFPFVRSSEYLAYQEEARKAKLGLWSSPESSVYILSLQEGLNQNFETEEKPLDIEVDPAPGLVASGTVVAFVSSEPAALFLSVNSGSFQRFSGTFIVTDSVHLQAYGEVTRITEEGSGKLVRSAVVGGSYIVSSGTFGTGFVISEIYPAPLSGESEWIELLNTSNHDISLFGWTVDDVREKGSKPIVIRDDRIIPGSGFLVLDFSGSKIAFNNDGDDASLISPDGFTAITITYPKVKRGQSYARNDDASFCVTDMPTPGEGNVCVIELKQKKPPKEPKVKKSTAKAPARRSSASAGGKKPAAKTVFRVKYQNVLREGSSEPDVASGTLTVRERLRKVHSAPESPPVNYAYEIEVIVLSLGFMASLRMIFQASLRA